VNTLFQQRPRLCFCPVAVVAAAIFHERRACIDRLKGDFKQGGPGINRIDPNHCRVHLTSRLHNRLSEAPRIRLDARFGACGELFMRLGEGARLTWIGVPHITKASTHAA